MKHRIVAVGTSAEGVVALRQVVGTLPAILDAADLVIVRTDTNESPLRNLLGLATSLPVDYACDAEPIIPARIYIAPPDRHMLIECGHIRPVHGPRENSARPPIDPLFRSATLAYGTRIIDIVLSGCLDDGTARCLAIKDQGGITVVQDPTDDTVPPMPSSAAAHVAVDYSRPIEDIGPLILALIVDTAITSAGLGSVGRRESFTRIIGLEHYMSAAGVALTDRDWWHELVTLSGLTCPECQGVLGKVRDRRVLRFRCQTGHAYSAKTLLKALAMTREAAVGAPLRALAQEPEPAHRLSLQPGQAAGGVALAKLAVSITSSVLEPRTMLRSQLQQT